MHPDIAVQRSALRAAARMNLDHVHRETLERLVAEAGLAVFTPEDRRGIWWDAMHSLRC